MLALANSPKPSLRDDQRGAVMLIGLFMALSLIGSLWFMIGIGQAIVFRDRGQEAADAMAMSVAAIDARGMDLIAVINIISLAMVGVYLVIQLVADILMCAIVTFVWGFRLDRFNTNMMQEKVLTVGLPVLGASSAAVAFLTPWMGTKLFAPEVAGHYPGFEKTVTFPAFGISNFPGIGPSLGLAHAKNQIRRKQSPSSRSNTERIADDLRQQREKYQKELEEAQARQAKGEKVELPKPPKPRKIEEIDEKVTTKEQAEAKSEAEKARNARAERQADVSSLLGTIRLGLPVAFETNKTLCPRAFALSADLIMKLFMIPSEAQTFIDMFVGLGANIYADLRCGNDPFPDPGPKKMAGSNGGLAMQVYAVALGNHRDSSESKVRLASHVFDDRAETDELKYTAQAEFFYNCEGQWFDKDCNGQGIGNGGPGREGAVYWPGWKARLVKYKAPEQALIEHWVGGLQSLVIGTVWDAIDIGVKAVLPSGHLRNGVDLGLKELRRYLDRNQAFQNWLNTPGNWAKEKAKAFEDKDNFH